LNAATRVRGMNYSTFVDGLKKAGVELDRKQLSEIAIKDPSGFDALVAEAKGARR
jgi:large subunit ribosomal protein L20